MFLHGLKKKNSIKMKRETTVWENIFANDTLDKVSSPKYMKNSLDSTPEKHKTQFKKWAKDLNRHFSKEDIQKAQRHTKR